MTFMFEKIPWLYSEEEEFSLWKMNNLVCNFSKCDPFVKLKLLRNFCCDFYGSCYGIRHTQILTMYALHGGRD